MRRALFVVLVVALLLPAASEAAFPGANGKIAFVRAGDIWTMNPDGTSQVNLTNSAAFEYSPSWSADGNRIVFGGGGTGLAWMYADGTGQTSVPVVPVDGPFGPSWSPDGTRIAFGVQDHCDPGGIWITDDNGANQTFAGGCEGDRITNDTAWSPDGQKIAFYGSIDSYDIFTLTPPPPGGYAPGTKLTTDGGCVEDENPNWSPDGQKIAWQLTAWCAELPPAVWTMNPDGTGKVQIRAGGEDPAWSPDGTKIAFVASGGINVMNSNGTGASLIATGNQPDWQPLNQAGPEADVLSTITDSPDPVRAGGILTYTAQAKNLVGPDPASGVTLTVTLPSSVYFVSATPSQGTCSQLSGTVTCNLGNLAEGASATVTIQVEPQTQSPITASANVTATEPDPVPGNNASQTTTTVSPGGYARPKGASPIRASLVPAFRNCDVGQATLTHGAPLSSPSCGSPELTSGYLTLGTSSSGFVKLVPVGEVPIDPNNGDQADVTYDLQLSDVRKASDLTDYTGELQVQATLRLTDKHSSPSGKAAATMSETSISFDAPCTATPAATGSTCNISTSADAVVPGIAQELRRAVWDLGKVRVLDSGADGDAQTGPNTLLAVQGVFVP